LTSTGGGLSGADAGEEVTFCEPGGPVLTGYLTRPSFSAASGSGRHGIVLVHGFPEAGQASGALARGYPELARRLAAETGAAVLAFDFRGTGRSGGDFSLFGWRNDLMAAMRTVRALPGVERLWLVGFAAGATLAIAVAAEDQAVAGVAAFAPQAELIDRSIDPRRLVAQARAAGLIRNLGYPPDPVAWARELRSVQPSKLAERIPPRPLLIVHGGSDEVVPLSDARELAEAAHRSAELRIVPSAGHMLLYDPRAVALLLGWFDLHLGEVVPK
jgi:pimeloyl-ACP methyl ester carboxylesterase